MAAGTKLKTHRLTIPVQPQDLEKLEIGDVVYLDGVVYTGREGLYKRVVEDGHALPEGLIEASNVNFHCSPAAAPRDGGEYEIGAVTATASFRFSKFMEKWFQASQVRVIIGKGGMSPEDYLRHFVPNGAIYLTTVGYGTGALLGRGVKKVRAVHWLEELGIAQALWLFEVENFGPFIVESDLAGKSLFERENAKIAEGLPKVFEGTRPAILRRFGETDDRTDELI